MIHVNYNNVSLNKNGIFAPQYSATPQVNFGTQRDKLISQILKSRPNHVQITTLLKGEGFDVSIISGRISAKKDGERIFTTTVSRGKQKFADPQAIVWLQKYFRTKKR